MRAQQLRKFLALLCLVVIVGFGAFAQKVIPIDTSNVTTLRIDPLNSYGGTATEVFESADYIPLETTKESLFGRIEQLEITDQYFIILDRSTNCILFFKKDGKYHSKIYGGSVSNNRDNAIYRFHVNKWKQEIVYYRGSRTGSKYLYYDFSGKKLREIVYDYKTDPELSDYQFISEDKVISSHGYYNDTVPPVSTRQLVEYVKDFKEIYASAFHYQVADYKYGNDNFLAYPNFTNAGNDTTFFYSKPSEYNIYKITPNTIKHTFKFILPLFRALPKGFATDSAFYEKRWDYIQKNKDIIYKLSDFYHIGDNLIFKVYDWNANNTQSNLIYNLRSGMLIAFDNILTDEKTFFLPIIERRHIIKGVLSSYGEHIYYQFSSLELFRSKEENKDKNLQYSPVLQRYFAKGADRDNPVILQIKLKEKL